MPSCLAQGTAPANSFLPVVPTMPALPQADVLVLIVRVAVVADVPETVVLGSEKHKLEEDGLLEIVQVIVPV